jgi:hypothetical protein
MTAAADLHTRLRAWARGYLPYMAAVEFLIETGEARPGHPLIATDPDAPDLAYLDIWSTDPDSNDRLGDWESRIGYASGGERATWRLAVSLAGGELGDELSRLDGTRRAAFIDAITEAWGVRR